MIYSPINKFFCWYLLICICIFVASESHRNLSLTRKTNNEHINIERETPLIDNYNFTIYYNIYKLPCWWWKTPLRIALLLCVKILMALEFGVLHIFRCVGFLDLHHLAQTLTTTIQDGRFSTTSCRNSTIQKNPKLFYSFTLPKSIRMSFFYPDCIKKKEVLFFSGLTFSIARFSLNFW